MEPSTLLNILKKRFNDNSHRHPDLNWEKLAEKLTPDQLESIAYMESTGGEPDLVFLQKGYYFVDCSKESPQRRSCCYDEKARLGRKKNPPAMSAQGEAQTHGLSLLGEDQYIALQDIEAFDEKTSSWLATEEDLRSLGGALFGDRRYNRTFIYHNGADSYYASRGFRCLLAIDL